MDECASNENAVDDREILLFFSFHVILNRIGVYEPSEKDFPHHSFLIAKRETQHVYGAHILSTCHCKYILW